MSRLDSTISYDAAADCILTIDQTLRAKEDIYGEDLAASVAGMQSLGNADFADVKATHDATTDILNVAGLQQLLVDEYGADNKEAIRIGMEAASIQMMVSGGMEMATNTPDDLPNLEKGTVVLAASDVVPGLQAFQNQDLGEYRATAIVMAGLTAASGKADELFYPTKVVEAGAQGRSVSVRIPYVYKRTLKSTDGSPMEIAMTPLMGAMEDHTILEADILKLLPNADNTANSAYLVDPAVVPNETIVVDGIDVNTRPIVFGKKTDLISLSGHTGLLGSAAQSETDTMSTLVNLGHVWAKISTSTTDAAGATVVKSSIVKFRVDGTPGSTFTRPSEGKDTDLSMLYTESLMLGGEVTGIDGVTITTAGLGIDGLIAAGGKAWTIQLPVRISGSCNFETSNIIVDGTAIDLGKVFIGDTEVAQSSAEYTALKAAMTLELIGYRPLATRTNSTLRQTGTLIDMGTARNYFFEVRPGSPVATRKPSGPYVGGGANLDYMKKALRTRTSNSTVTNILAQEQAIIYAAANSAPVGGSTTIGGMYVRPTYLVDNIDAALNVVFQNSIAIVENLRSVMYNAMGVMADTMAISSGYITALGEFPQGEQEYDIIAICDPRLAPLFMRSGDERTLGANNNLIVASHLDKRMRGKVLFSFSRRKRAGDSQIDPLSWGARYVKPPIVHTAKGIVRNDAILDEIHVLPQEHHINVLPILGRINVTNLETVYKHISKTTAPA